MELLGDCDRRRSNAGRARGARRDRGQTQLVVVAGVAKAQSAVAEATKSKEEAAATTDEAEKRMIVIEQERVTDNDN